MEKKLSIGLNGRGSTKTSDAVHLKKFGLTLGVISIAFFGVLIPLLKTRPFSAWPWILAGILGILSITAPKALAPVYTIWMKVGHILGWMNTRIILTIFFIVIFIPFAFIMRLMKRDPLERKFEPLRPTYVKTRLTLDPKKMETPF